MTGNPCRTIKRQNVLLRFYISIHIHDACWILIVPLNTDTGNHGNRSVQRTSSVQHTSQPSVHCLYGLDYRQRSHFLNRKTKLKKNILMTTCQTFKWSKKRDKNSHRRERSSRIQVTVQKV